MTDAILAPKADFETQKTHYAKAVAEKKKFIEILRAANYKKLADAGVEIIDGIGEFVDKKTIKVRFADGLEEEIFAEKIIINTGARPVLPKIEGIKDNRKVFLSETILDLEELPQRLTIIGGGYIGLEFAAMYANLEVRLPLYRTGKSSCQGKIGI